MQTFCGAVEVQRFGQYENLLELAQFHSGKTF
jgi:hypothetical protein